MLILNTKARQAFTRAKKKGIEITDTKKQIVDIVLEQEIVSYCNSKGCVSFDVNDLEEIRQ